MSERLSTQISKYFDRLWPLNRSITGQGVRKTHKILKEIIPFKTLEIPSGLKVHDWKVPKEWIIKDALSNFSQEVLDSLDLVQEQQIDTIYIPIELSV